MHLYYHHVGHPGNQDFDKTVFRPVALSLVEQVLSRLGPEVQDVAEQLRHLFPEGEANAWGVPQGADPVVRDLREGDCVLLVESIRIDGMVPALCPVTLFPRLRLRPLSQALWGDEKYPYIFFFRTERLALPWKDVLRHWGYRENFNPRGQFYKVADVRLAPFGGAEGYVTFLRRTYRAEQTPVGLLTVADVDHAIPGGAAPTSIAEVAAEIRELATQSLEPEPGLTDEALMSTQRRLVRRAAFTLAVRRLYEYRCAVCGSGLRGPKGEPEVEAAHIFPKRLRGSDDLRNGICLCRLHHWAFDVGWFDIADDYTVRVRPGIPVTPDYAALRGLDGRKARLPRDRRFRPHPIYLRARAEQTSREHALEVASLPLARVPPAVALDPDEDSPEASNARS